MGEVVDVTKTTVKVKADFWHTGVGIFIKRVAIQAIVTGGIIVADALTSPSVDWHAVIYGLRVQGGYILVSTLQTLKDPQIPNTTSETLTIKKEGE